jgi:hypothetical protein
MRAALEQKVAAVARAGEATLPACPACGQPMPRKDARRVTWLSRFGRVAARPARYCCGPCGQTRRPLLEALGVEPGRLCGSLARVLALLGVVVPFELAARLAELLLGVRVTPLRDAKDRKIGDGKIGDPAVSSVSRKIPPFSPYGGS